MAIGSPEFPGMGGGHSHQAVTTGDSPSAVPRGGSGADRWSTLTATGGLVEGRAMIAELIATFTLIFVGVGAIAVTAPLGSLQSLVAVALAHGLALAVMVSATAAISGGHVNPAVTLGALVGGRIGVAQAVGHWVAQLAGGIAGAAVIGAILPAGSLAHAGFGVPVPGAGVAPWTAVVVELILTFFLVFVVFGTAIDERAPRAGGLFIGLTLVMAILIGGPLTGAALNPARFLGPAIVNASHLGDTWIYLVGPLAGGLLAGLVWRFAFRVARPATAV